MVFFFRWSYYFKTSFRENLDSLLAEREDCIKVLQQQLIDTKKITVDLYKKIRLADDKYQAAEKELRKMREMYSQVFSLLSYEIF